MSGRLVVDLDADLVEDLRADGVRVEQVGRNAEFWLIIHDDRYTVFYENDGWYADLTAEGWGDPAEEGPYATAEDAIRDNFFED